MAATKVLIIDDDQDILETTGSILQHEGFDVHSAESVEEGIRKIESVKPQVVLLDIMFPEKKTRGFEAAEEIKGKYPKLPVIVLTAINREYAFDFTKDDIKADAFLNKPVSMDKLMDLIRQYVGTSEK